jgi:ABC-type glycerol-3-phosphate transport system permease component
VKPSRRIDISRLLIHAVIILISFIFIFPFLYIIVTAFKTEFDTINNPALLSLNFTLENFQMIHASGVKLGAYYLNSVILTSVSTIVVVIVSAAGGYGFAKFRFKARQPMLVTMLLTMTFPLGALLVPMYIMEFKLQIADTLFGLILPNIAVNTPFAIFIMQAIFRTIPDELIDYAEIDGCTPFRTWRQIMIPVAKNGLLTAGILCFRSVWGEYTLARTLSSSVRSIPLSVGLTYLKWERWHFGIMSAIILLAIIPPVIIFLIFRNYFQRGLAIGAVKG